MAKIIAPGKTGPETIELGSFMVTIGRHSDSNVNFEERSVASEHALVGFDGQQYFVEDLGSRQGTQVNGERIKGRATLRDGDRIGIDAHIIRFEDPPEAAADPVPASDAQPAPSAPPSAGAEMLGRLMNSIRSSRGKAEQERQDALNRFQKEWEKLLELAEDLKSRVGQNERLKYFGIDRRNQDIIIRIQSSPRSPQYMITAALQHPNSTSPIISGIWLIRTDERDECYQTAEEVSTEIIRELALHLA